VTSVEAALVARIAADTSYLNIQTTAFPGGEIRGFLLPAATAHERHPPGAGRDDGPGRQDLPQPVDRRLTGGGKGCFASGRDVIEKQSDEGFLVRDEGGVLASSEDDGKALGCPGPFPFPFSQLLHRDHREEMNDGP